MTLFEGHALLPCHGLVDYGASIRLAGYVEETEIGGAQFLSITPEGRSPVLINATHVISIFPCDELQARREASRQWATS